MKLRHIELVTAIILLTSLNLATSLKCFTCSSTVDKGCGDPFVNASLPAVVCGDLNAVCVKQVLQDSGIFRGCVTPDYCKVFVNKSKYCSMCTKDYCNFGFRELPSMSLLLLPTSILIFRSLLYDN